MNEIVYMKKELTRSFQLNRDHPSIDSLDTANAKISIGFSLMEEIREELTEEVKKKQSILDKILSEKFGYFIKNEDLVYYNPQTLEIRIYRQSQESPPLFNEEQKP